MNNYLINLKNFFRSEEAVLLSLLLSLITQLGHSINAYAFLESKIFNEEPSFISYVFGTTFAFAVSTAIIIFTMQQRKGMAYFFLIVEVFINIIYSRLENNYSLYTWYSLVFLAIVIPVTISAYSHHSDKKESIENKELENIKIIELENNISNINDSVNDIKKSLDKQYLKKGDITLKIPNSQGIYQQYEAKID